MGKDSFAAKALRKIVEFEKRKSRDLPAIPFVGEKKQMWYFLMNQVDKTPSEDEKEEAQS
jgi:hypothetical protein